MMIVGFSKTFLLSSFFLVLCATSTLLCVNCEAIGYFWHISDAHVDQNYSRTGNPSNMCHEDGGHPSLDNGLFGNFNCDSPQSLVNVSVQAMKDIHADPDFILWTGDNLPHSVDVDPTWDVTFEAIRNTTSLLRSLFPDVPVIPCIGNHDTFPANTLPANDSTHSIYKGYLEKGEWNKILKEDAWTTFLQGGYFSYLVKPALRIISLNTILWYTPNNLTINVADPGNQFVWLDSVLRNASKFSEKVYLMGHVPPGYYTRVNPGQKSDPTFHPQHAETYNQLLLKYSRIIIGQFYGHHHLDTFQVFQYGTGTFKGSSLLAASITPWHNLATVASIPVNPTLRLMHYSQIDGQLLNFDQYFLNLSKANALKDDLKKSTNLYEYLYSFTQFYGVPDLSTASLVRVYEKLKSDPVAYDGFYNFLSGGKRSVPCDEPCKVAQLCAMSCVTPEEYDECVQSTDYACVASSEGHPFLLSNTFIICAALSGFVTVSLLVGFIVYINYFKVKRRARYTRFNDF